MTKPAAPTESEISSEKKVPDSSVVAVADCDLGRDVILAAMVGMVDGSAADGEDAFMFPNCIHPAMARGDAATLLAASGSVAMAAV